MPKMIYLAGPLKPPMKNTPGVGIVYWKNRKCRLRSSDEVRIEVPIRFTDNAIKILYDDFLIPFWNECISGKKEITKENNMAKIEHLNVVARLLDAARYKIVQRYGYSIIPPEMMYEMEPDPWCITKDIHNKDIYLFNFRLVVPRDKYNRYQYVNIPKEILNDL